jgi:hypothetical protein
MYDITVIIIIVLITLLKKMLNKIQEFEKRLDDTKIVQLDEKKEHTEKTEKMLNKIQELEKRLDDNNIIDFCEALDLQNKIQELEKRLDYDAIKVLYEHAHEFSDKIKELEISIADLDENKELVNKIVIALVECHAAEMYPDGVEMDTAAQEVRTLPARRYALECVKILKQKIGENVDNNHNDPPEFIRNFNNTLFGRPLASPDIHECLRACAQHHCAARFQALCRTRQQQNECGQEPQWDGPPIALLRGASPHKKQSSQWDGKPCGCVPFLKYAELVKLYNTI